MPIVQPDQYAETPIFREMLQEREGRFPGTPEGEEDLPMVNIFVPVDEEATTSRVGVLTPVIPLGNVPEKTVEKYSPPADPN